MRIAIIGCGQLARMLALAGWPMGMQFSFLAEADEDTRCVDGLGEVVRLQTGITPLEVYAALGHPDVVTVEKEAVDVGLLQEFQQYCTVAPSPEILHTIQNRARQKKFLQHIGIPTAPFLPINKKEDLWQALDALDYPVIIKSSENGYDGQQQWHVHNATEAHAFIDSPFSISDVVVEKKLNFEREVSLIVARNTHGEVAVYSPTENTHHHGTLSVSVSPTQNLNASISKQLFQIIDTLMGNWQYVGVLAIECFVVDGKIIVNELAPRVHNSGHWTQDGAATSQFENHLRAICGLTLGSTENLGHTAMINLLGCMAPEKLASHPHAHVHLYNKTLRSGRKMGHINLLYQDSSELSSNLSSALMQLNA
jgi:5-(carboxyamino)imidazole ribonucleotide synthase